jgi:predicted RNA-binding Zn-ribbon protein involved in translation (DUF1610 family)
MSSTSPEYQALVQRWDGFLGKIKDRYNEVIDMSREPLKEMITGLEYDSIVLHNALQGIKNQSVFQLDKKINEAWEKMENEADKLGINYGLMDTPREKSSKTSKWMWDEFERFSVKIFADAARQIEKNIRSVVDENTINNCVSCAGQLPVEIWAFQAVNVICPNCGSVNTYEPDGRVRAMEGVIGAYAQEHAVEEWIKHGNGDDKKDSAEYYKKYYTFFIENLPQRKEHYERLLNDKLSNFHFVGK